MSFLTVAEYRKDPERALLAARVHPEAGSITFGSQVRVDEGQEAIFRKEGRTVSVLGPGRLTAFNGTLWSHLFRQIFGGVNAWRAEVWLIDKTLIPGWRWSLERPMNLARDLLTNLPLEITLDGTYAMRVVDSELFLSRVVGNADSYAAAILAPWLGGIAAQNAVNVCGQALQTNDYSWLGANLSDVGVAISRFANGHTVEYGVGIDQVTVQASLTQRSFDALTELVKYENMTRLMEDRLRRLGADGFAVAQITEALTKLAEKGPGSTDLSTILLLGKLGAGFGPGVGGGPPNLLR